MSSKSRLNPGRLAAGRVLLASVEGKHADTEMERQSSLSPADRGLAWHLVQGVLRHRGELDAALGQLSKRPVASLDVAVQVALRVGAFEVRYSRTPRHAAVDQGVRLAIALKAGRAKGLVNALLRRVGDVRLPTSATRNHPDWLVQRWRERYGTDAVDAWCARNDTQAPLTLSFKELSKDMIRSFETVADSVAPALFGEKTLVDSLELVGPHGAVSGLPGFGDGSWWVMDPAAIATADLVGAKAGERVLDACAAPGGKTFRMARTGASVVACDRSHSRLARLQENGRRIGLEAEIHEMDWSRSPGSELGLFDAVLVDAPCTGLGTVRRHPEIRWRSLPSDPLAMSLTQKPILQAASARVRAGGRLVYAVCSPEPEEGVDVVNAFLEQNSEFRLEKSFECAPPVGQEDAFYAARLIRGEP